MAETEDIPYEVDDFATPDEEAPKGADVDQPNKSVLKSIQKYLVDAIAEHNSLDVVEPGGENTMTTQQQVQMHKQIVAHLRSIKVQIDNKIKELA